VGLLSSTVTGCAPTSQEPPALAVVNGKPITQEEFDYRWSELPEATRDLYESQGGKKKFLDDLISREILLQEARRLGLDHSLAMQERLERVKEQLVLDELMKEAVTTTVQVSDTELHAYYDQHRSALLSALQIRAAHILLPTDAQAKDVKHQLNQGYNFGKLAQRYSIDETTRANGGELGLYRSGMADPGIEPALMTQKPGIISEPIQTAAGFHIVKVLARDPDDAQHVEAVRQRLRRELFAEKRRKQFEDILVNLRAHATVRVATASGLGIREPSAASTVSSVSAP
ncbi:MAG TPA: peptidylprolyl isomerase, partial [Nitrospiraceae bacterium]|nr:peptidylprolyl isomerase [Nitrospiraceae bacterium]